MSKRIWRSFICLTRSSNRDLATSTLSVGRGAPAQSSLYCFIRGFALAVDFASFSAKTCFAGTIIRPLPLR